MITEQASRLDDEKWKSAYALFERAVKLPASERQTFLQQASQDSEVLQLVPNLWSG